MRYMLFLQNSSYQPNDSLWLKNKARELASAGGITIRDTRVSRFHIEFDISIPDYDKIANVAYLFREIGDYSSSYHVIEKRRGKKEAISEAKYYFNEEKYWIAHEILESIWKESKGLEKELIGGLILICAAYVHYQKAEEEICISILTRATKKLTNANGTYYDFDVDKMKHRICDIISSGKATVFKT
jgi:uncharacterized protein